MNIIRDVLKVVVDATQEVSEGLVDGVLVPVGQPVHVLHELKGDLAAISRGEPHGLKVGAGVRPTVLQVGSEGDVADAGDGDLRGQVNVAARELARRVRDAAARL